MPERRCRVGQSQTAERALVAEQRKNGATVRAGPRLFERINVEQTKRLAQFDEIGTRRSDDEQRAVAPQCSMQLSWVAWRENAEREHNR